MFLLRKCVSFLLCALLSYMTLAAIAGNLESGIKLYDQQRFKEAFPLIKKEAEKGNTEAQFYVGKMYELGEGTQKNIKKAVYWYQKAVEKNNRKAENNLANLYAEGDGVEKDLKKAFELYSRAANQGTASAQFNLAMMYRKGEATEKNYEESFNLFLKAANSGYKRAMHAVGIAYQFGKGVPVDRGEAAKWYEKAAEQNYLPSIQNLGALYMADGDGLSEDWDKTYYWSQKGLELGDKGISALRLGIIYFSGHGTHPVDNAKATYYFNLAGENGRADAWYWLGTMQEYGFGGKPDMDKAMAYYRRSADEGFKPAEKRLEQKDPSWTVRFFWWARKVLGAD